MKPAIRPLFVLIFIPLMSIVSGPSRVASAQTINVEVDYMVKVGTGAHSHQPSAFEIQRVIDMFACHGITLNVVVDDAIPEIPVMQCSPPGSESIFACAASTSFASLKSAWSNHGSGWHYAIFGHNYNETGPTTSSGIAVIGGKDLAVTLGSFSGQIGTPFDRASTFAHELGHNLGLHHYSYADIGQPGNYSVNYASVMSYQYQLTGVRTRLSCLGMIDESSAFRDLDYSFGKLPALNETSLDETRGVGIRAIDWNCNGVVDAGTVHAELDNKPDWCSAASGGTAVVRDQNDWGSLVDNAVSDAAEGDPKSDVETCITADEVLALQERTPGSCRVSQPALQVEGCVDSTRMNWVDPAAASGGSGSGDAPFRRVLDAVNHTQVGGVLYLQPGAHTNGGTPLILNTPITLAGPGGATISR